jgi:hypothetical protein
MYGWSCGYYYFIGVIMKEYKVYQDGDLWCAVNEEFINIKESVMGFGLTPMAALGELVKYEEEIKKMDVLR